MLRRLGTQICGWISMKYNLRTIDNYSSNICLAIVNGAHWTVKSYTNSKRSPNLLPAYKTRYIRMRYAQRITYVFTFSLQWRHNGSDGVSIPSLSTVCSTIYSGADQRKHQSSASLAFVRGIHRWAVISPHKWPVTRKMFPFDDVIKLWFIEVKLKRILLLPSYLYYGFPIPLWRHFDTELVTSVTLLPLA